MNEEFIDGTKKRNWTFSPEAFEKTILWLDLIF